MNNLEPWKIWAVTAVLVVAILGVGSAKSRPDALAEPAAVSGAAQAPSDSSPASALQQPTEYDAYSFGTAYRPYSPALYPASITGQASSMSLPQTSTVAFSDSYYQTPELTISQQIAVPESVEPETVADYDPISPDTEYASNVNSDADAGIAFISRITPGEQAIDNFILSRTAELAMRLDVANNSVVVNGTSTNATLYFTPGGDQVWAVESKTWLGVGNFGFVHSFDSPAFDGAIGSTLAVIAVGNMLQNAVTEEAPAIDEPASEAILLRDEALANAQQVQAALE